MFCHSVVFLANYVNTCLLCYLLLYIIFNETGTKYMWFLLGEHAHLSGQKVEMKGKKVPLPSEDPNPEWYLQKAINSIFKIQIHFVS